MTVEDSHHFWSTSWEVRFFYLCTGHPWVWKPSVQLSS